MIRIITFFRHMMLCCLFSILSNISALQAQQNRFSTLGFVLAAERYDANSSYGAVAKPTWSAKAWKGEKVALRVLLHSKAAINAVSIHPSDLKGVKGNTIPASAIAVFFVRTVLADSLALNGENCGGPRPPTPKAMEDVLDTTSVLEIQPNTNQTAWISIHVPADATPGLYKGSFVVEDGAHSKQSLPYTLEVVNRKLPQPKDYRFHLDLWQSPFAVARYHGVEPWSDAHFSHMRPLFKMLADAGQKVVTTSIIHDPWNSQTFDVYHSMIRWTKQTDGTWNYNFDVFDKWVQFMMDLGIDKEIGCFSMIPWNLKFYYHDAALQRDTFIIAKPGEAAYTAHWQPMLEAFANHLKEKGWFEKTAIAMDERPMKDMQAAIKVIKASDKDWKISLAGNYHPEIEADLYDYCIASNLQMPDSVLQKRKSKGFITTFYTACPESYPNVFTFSSPAESAFMGWYAAAANFDGYLRWAYNSWPKDPVKDSRFGTWPSGDTYFVYPGARSSVRFEMLIQGIQAYEKIQVLQKEFLAKGNKAALQKLEAVLKTVQIKNMRAHAAKPMLEAASKALNAL